MLPLLAVMAIGAVMSGISSSMKAKGQMKQLKAKAKYEEQDTHIKGDEDRRSALYQFMLEDYGRKEQKYEKKLGLDNYLAYGKTQPAVTPHVGALMSFQSPNQMQNPGKAPPSAQPLNSVTSDYLAPSSNYGFDQNGNLVSLPWKH